LRIARGGLVGLLSDCDVNLRQQLGLAAFVHRDRFQKCLTQRVPERLVDLVPVGYSLLFAVGALAAA